MGTFKPEAYEKEKVRKKQTNRRKLQQPGTLS